MKFTRLGAFILGAALLIAACSSAPSAVSQAVTAAPDAQSDVDDDSGAANSTATQATFSIEVSGTENTVIQSDAGAYTVDYEEPAGQNAQGNASTNAPVGLYTIRFSDNSGQYTFEVSFADTMAAGTYTVGTPANANTAGLGTMQPNNATGAGTGSNSQDTGTGGNSNNAAGTNTTGENSQSGSTSGNLPLVGAATPTANSGGANSTGSLPLVGGSQAGNNAADNTGGSIAQPTSAPNSQGNVNAQPATAPAVVGESDGAADEALSATTTIISAQLITADGSTSYNLLQSGTLVLDSVGQNVGGSFNFTLASSQTTPDQVSVSGVFSNLAFNGEDVAASNP